MNGTAMERIESITFRGRWARIKTTEGRVLKILGALWAKMCEDCDAAMLREIVVELLDESEPYRSGHD